MKEIIKVFNSQMSWSKVGELFALSCLPPIQSSMAKKVHPCYDLLQITPPFFTDQLHKKHATTFMVIFFVSTNRYKLH